LSHRNEEDHKNQDNDDDNALPKGTMTGSVHTTKTQEEAQKIKLILQEDLIRSRR